jgi:predicted TIM-barrel fold metal-dependent hydrolase
MEVIDAQIHDPHPVAALDRKYMGEFEVLLGTELAREAMDAVGVDIALMNTRQDLLDFAIARYPERFVGCGRLDARAVDLEEQVRTFRDRPGMLAVRSTAVNWATRQESDEFHSGRLEPLFTAAEKHRLPLFLFASGICPSVVPVAERHPNLTLIIDHNGLPSPPPMKLDADPWTQLPEVLTLARFPNVAVKLSAPNALSKKPYPHEDVWPHMHKLLKAFGPERLVFASDFTRLRMAPGTTDRGRRDQWAALYGDSVNYLRDTTEVSQSDKELLFGGALRSLLRWPRTDTTPHR